MSSTIIRTTSDETRIVVQNADVLDALVGKAEAAASESGSGARWLFNEHRLRRTRSKLARLKAGEDVQLHLAFIGDSLTNWGGYYVTDVAKRLQDEFGLGAIGWHGLGFLGTVGMGGFNPLLTARDDLISIAYAGSGMTCSYHAGSISPDSCHIVMSQSGDKVTWTSSQDVTAAKLYVPGPTSGSVRYRKNGGAWTTWDVTTVATVNELWDMGALSGSWTLEIEWVSGTPHLAGVDFQNDEAGVVVHKLGASGAKASDWASANEAGQISGWTSLGPDAFFVKLGYNDASNGDTASTYDSGLATITSRMLSAIPAADITLAVPAENPAGYSVPMSDYVAAAKNRALAQGFAFIDFQPLFGDADDTAEYANGGDIPLFLADDTHYAVAGRGIVKDAYYRAITSAVIGGATVSASFDDGGRALAELTGANDTMPYFTGPTTASTTALTASGRSLLALNGTADKGLYFSGTGTAALFDLTSVARTLLGQTTQANMRTTGLGLGTMATQAASSVAITGGTISGVSTLSATVASNKSWALQNITTSSLSDFSTGGGGATFSRPSDGTLGLAGLYVYNTGASLTNFVVAARGDVVLCAGGIGLYTASPEVLRLLANGAAAFTGAVTTTGSGLGYATGAGGAVTQATSRTTGVTLNKATGAITLVSAAGSTSWQSFTVTNSTVAATDTVRICQKSGTDLYMIHVTAVAAGSFRVTFATTGGTTTEQPVFNFTVIKGAAS